MGAVYSSGVGILFWDQEIEVENYFTVSQGRVVGADVKWKGVNIDYFQCMLLRQLRRGNKCLICC